MLNLDNLDRAQRVRLAYLLKERRIRKSRKGFKEFVLHTKPDFIVNWHHEIMFDTLQRFANGEIQNLAIEAPPRHTKSETVSRRLPAYLLGLDPKIKIILGAYADSLASSMNRDVQRIIDEKAYQELFPHTFLSGKNVRSDSKGSWIRNADQFETVGHGGGMKTVGRGAGATGFGSDCFVAGTKILTKNGWFNIENLVDGVRVASYCHERKKAEYRTIVAVRAKKSNNIYQIRTVQGLQFISTGCHKVFSTDRGYAQACDLKKGERLIRAQFDGELNYGLSLLSYDSPQVAEDAVSSVKKYSDKEHVVYDIQVEGNHNFFANGVLVHNCTIIDDPLKNREEARSQTIRDKTWDWFTNDILTRSEGRKQVLVTQCMTGDTLVLMADGSQKTLESIVIGDKVATYEKGKIKKAKVLNWKCNGADLVYKIRTTSGKSIRANERHPFLIFRDEELQWVRLTDLKIKDKMICLGEHGKENHVLLRDVTNRLSPKGTAIRTITKQDGLLDIDLHQSTMNQEGAANCATDTELNPSTTTKCLKRNQGVALFVKQSSSPELICQSIGKKCASITTMLLEKLEACCVMFATLLSKITPRKKFYNQHLITFDSIEAIDFDCVEDVFDVQIERTENFIANGVVSHNTRWHEDDLIGRIRANQKNADFPQFEFLTLQAIKTSSVNHPKDPRKDGEALWQSRYPVELLMQRRATLLHEFESLYQQEPSPAEGGKVKKKDLKFYGAPIEMRHFQQLMVSADLSFDDNDGSDFNVFSVYGRIDTKIYLIDQIRAQMDIIEQIRTFKLLQAKYQTLSGMLVEKKANGAAALKLLEKKIMGLIPITPVRSKVDRLDSVLPLYAAGNVWYPDPSFAPWIVDHVKEMLTFPNGKFDDRVDAETQALSWMGSEFLEWIDSLTTL